MKKSIAITAVIGAVCAAGGGALGISSSAAAPGSGSDAQRPQVGAPGHGHRPGGGIHSETVVPDRDGQGFTTIVTDAGTLTAIDGTTLTLKEGTADETYATVDVVADGTVSVRRNGRTVQLSALRVGDHVRVAKDGTNTRIFASTAAWEQAQAQQHRRPGGASRPAAPTWPAV